MSRKIIYATTHRNTQRLWDKKKIISEDDGRSIKYSGQYSMFSISESAAQDCILHYQEQYGLKAIILRLPPVYGYGPHTEIFMMENQSKPDSRFLLTMPLLVSQSKFGVILLLGAILSMLRMLQELCTKQLRIKQRVVYSIY